MTYNEKIKRLEKITESLESESVDLEDAISLYEEGIALVQDCENTLDQTKQKVMILTEENEELSF